MGRGKWIVLYSALTLVTLYAVIDRMTTTNRESVVDINERTTASNSVENESDIGPKRRSGISDDLQQESEENHGVLNIQPRPSKRRHEVADEQYIIVDILEREIGSLTLQRIEQEASEIEKRIYDENMIDRLNANSMGHDERANAHQLFVRLALLKVEKSRRDLELMVPELESLVMRE